jgi:hypothetical protein
MHWNKVYNIIQNLTLLFCDWGRQRRLSFYFPGNTGRVLAMREQWWLTREQWWLMREQWWLMREQWWLTEGAVVAHW